MMMIELAQLHA